METAYLIQPGVLTTAVDRWKTLLQLQENGNVPLWVERALRSELPVQVAVEEVIEDEDA
jgi:hypothetical protein